MGTQRIHNNTARDGVAGSGLGRRFTRRDLLRGGAAAGALLAVPSLLSTACQSTLTDTLAGAVSPTTTTTMPAAATLPATVCAFRNSLSISPFAEQMFQMGLSFSDGTRTATTVQQLQELFNAHGATEMYARISTLKVSGWIDGGAEMGWARGLERAKLAATLGMPFNPEIGLFASYGDSLHYQQAPDFTDYPGIKLPGPWFTLTIDQMVTALRQYGAAIATQILATGVHVDHWDLGNEVDFGVAGVTPQPLWGGPYTAPDNIDPAIGKTTVVALTMMAEADRIAWCNAHLWPYLGKLLAAARDGIRSVDPTAKFSTHIAGSGAWTATSWTAFWDAMNLQGYLPDTFGTSLYPSGPPPIDTTDPFGPVRKAAALLHTTWGRPSFVAEWGYPSTAMTSDDLFNHPMPGYPFDTTNQDQIFRDFVTSGIQGGWLSGMRPWGPDSALGTWGPMSFFDVSGSTASAKPAIDAVSQCIGA
jgi:hypothetical protein